MPLIICYKKTADDQGMLFVLGLIYVSLFNFLSWCLFQLSVFACPFVLVAFAASSGWEENGYIKKNQVINVKEVTFWQRFHVFSKKEVDKKTNAFIMAECQLQEKLQHTILVTCTVDVAEGQVHHDIQSHCLFVVHGLWCHFLCLQQGGFCFFFLHLQPLLNITQSQWLLEGNVIDTYWLI